MKTPPPQDLLVWALLDPARMLTLGLRGWNDVLLLGRQHGVLARLGELLMERGLLERIPDKARGHIRAVCISAQSSQTAIRWEVTKVLRALADVDSPIILLKGAAYVMAGLPAARGRSVGDLDLMVPRNKIAEVERVLTEKGWKPSAMDEYDQRFYRDWGHEIPPMQHPERETVLDIHHTIVPLTSRFHPDAAAMLASSVPLGNPRLRVLCPADMVLHSTVHVFNDEVGNPFRDLVDLHGLLSHFGAQPGFWDELIARAKLHGLGRPLYYMLRHTQRVLGTPVPVETVRAAAADAPGWFLNTLMDWLFMHRFVPEPLDKPRAGAGFAQWLYYVRAHWLRMPTLMLVRHLTIKAVRRLRERSERKPEEDV